MIAMLLAASFAVAAPLTAKPSREQAALDAADADAIVERRRIERALEEAAEELLQVRETISKTPRFAGDDSTGLNVRSEDGNDQRELDSVSVDLRTREQALLTQIATLKNEFAKLTSAVEKRHGGNLPASWKTEPHCRDCPE
jgi:hypothetical protein